MSSKPKVAIYTSAAAASERDLALSATLQLPLITAASPANHDCAFFLRYEAAGLTLYQNSPGAPGGLCVNFDNGDLLRRVSDKLKQQNLIKAVGLKGQTRLHILDAMAGLGKDAWLLASGGAEVELLERSSIVHALLLDGLTRRHGQPTADSAQRMAALQLMRLRHADFCLIADELPVFDVVYLDPMFPQAHKNARAKKDMYLLQMLLGSSSCDEQQILREARKHARRRVVVKRAKLSPYLAGERPDIEFKGTSNRYDVYLCSLAVNQSDQVG